MMTRFIAEVILENRMKAAIESLPEEIDDGCLVGQIDKSRARHP